MSHQQNDVIMMISQLSCYQQLPLQISSHTLQSLHQVIYPIQQSNQTLTYFISQYNPINTFYITAINNPTNPTTPYATFTYSTKFKVFKLRVNQQQYYLTEYQIQKYRYFDINKIIITKCTLNIQVTSDKKQMIEELIKQVEKSSYGLEEKVREVVQLQNQTKIKNLQNQKQSLEYQNKQIKKLLEIIIIDTTKNNFFDVINVFKHTVAKLLNKKVNIGISYSDVEDYQKKINIGIKAIEQVKRMKLKQIQDAKKAQQVTYDPFDIVNKMRLFSVFKMGCTRIMIQNDHTSDLLLIHNTVITQSQRQKHLKKQLAKIQQELEKKKQQLEHFKSMCADLQNQKNKLKIFIRAKEKKIQQKDREIQLLKIKNSNFAKQPHLQPLPNNEDQKLQKIQDLAKLSHKQHRKSVKRKIDKLANVSNIEVYQQGTLSIYDKFQLSNRDSTWKQKCQKLYIQNKKLQEQLENLKAGQNISSIRKGHSVSVRNKKISNQALNQDQIQSWKDNRKNFPNISFKFNLMKQNQNLYL